MVEAKGQNKNRMVYTPEHRIPLGEAVKTGTGEYALKIKKTNSSKTEVIPIGVLLSQIIQIIGKES